MAEKVKLQQRIHKNTLAILSKYKKIADKLATVPTNPVLEEFLGYLRGTLDYYNKKYPDVSQVDLEECKSQYEPVQGLNKIEQAFNNLEQGFYMQYPSPTFGTDIQQLFKATTPYYDRLNAVMALIKS
jgi:hypothetical protein